MELWLADIRELADRERECMARLPSGRRREAERHRLREERLLKAAAGLLLRRVLDVREDGDLRRNSHGKPSLTAGGPEFSLSHGGNYAVLAVHDGSVGVDVEPVGQSCPVISKRFLRTEELSWLGDDPAPERFAVLWTRLESALKADGRGFDMENRDFSVVESGRPWHLHTFLWDGHVISCAAENPFEAQVTKLSGEELLK